MLGHILVVDNDPPTAEFIAEALGDEGYSVATALTPSAARAAILEQRPDLVLLDFHLPELAGDVLAHELRIDGLADAPILLMTADTRIANELTIDGIDFCLLKPFDLDELLNCVAQHLRPRQARAVR